MKNMKKFYFAVMSLPLMLGACNGQKETNFPTEAVMSFSDVATMEVVTRADASAYDGTFKFMMPKNDYYTDDVTSTASNSTGSWVIAGAPVYLTPASRELYAWSPEGLEVADQTTLLTSQVYAADKDVLYFYKAEVNSGSPAVDVLFEHAYAQLSFVLSADYKGSKKLKNFTISGLNETATVDFKTGGITSPSAAVDLVLKATDVEETFPAKLSALAVPATTVAADQLKITCTIDGQTYSNISLNKVTALEHGKEYVVTLNIKGGEMGVTSVKVQGWTAVTSDVDLN